MLNCEYFSNMCLSIYCRELDQLNLCKFVAGCIDVPNVCILTEYCPKGSISDVLMNDEVPLNWAFRLVIYNSSIRFLKYLWKLEVFIFCFLTKHHSIIVGFF